MVGANLVVSKGIPPGIHKALVRSGILGRKFLNDLTGPCQGNSKWTGLCERYSVGLPLGMLSLERDDCPHSDTRCPESAHGRIRFPDRTEFEAVGGRAVAGFFRGVPYYDAHHQLVKCRLTEKANEDNLDTLCTYRRAVIRLEDAKGRLFTHRFFLTRGDRAPMVKN
ncbi:MAG: hypothetical protein AB7P17_02740 [Nitrospirales bacterium]|nr:hypothetical protein [Nitrospirales bacterium]